MKKVESLGVVETLYFAVAVEILDKICKDADVELIHSETSLGGKLVTLFISGSISNVTDAIEFVNRLATTTHKNYIKNAIVINKPHIGILEYIIPKEVK